MNGKTYILYIYMYIYFRKRIKNKERECYRKNDFR